MSKIEVDAIEPQSGTSLTLGASGDTLTVPSGATLTVASGATINNQGTATNFGATGAVSWNTTKITADPGPAVAGVGYFCDTSGGAFTVTLPSSPSIGDYVVIADYGNNASSNNIIIDGNGSKILGTSGNRKIQTNK